MSGIQQSPTDLILLLPKQWEKPPGLGQGSHSKRWRYGRETTRIGISCIIRTHKNALYLFNSRHELFWNICANGSVFKFQFRVVLRIQGLKDTDDFAVLSRSARLLLVCIFKPKNRQIPHYSLHKPCSDHSALRKRFPTCILLYSIWLCVTKMSKCHGSSWNAWGYLMPKEAAPQFFVLQAGSWGIMMK